MLKEMNSEQGETEFFEQIDRFLSLFTEWFRELNSNFNNRIIKEFENLQTQDLREEFHVFTKNIS